MEQTDVTKRKTGSHLPKGPHPKWFVEAGQRFGMGVVIDPEIRVPGKSPGRTFRGARLRCDCGNEYEAQILDLVGSDAHKRSGKSCGCTDRRRRASSPRRPRQFVDRTGRRSGALVVISLAEPRVFASGKRHIQWLCRCDCGNEPTVDGESLKNGRTKSCGCQWRVPRLPPGSSARNRVLKAYTGSARKRGLRWGLTGEDFDRLTALRCFYCGSEPSSTQASPGSLGEFVYNGLDRVDNDLGYTLENVVPCCEICNKAKRDMPYAEFMAWIARLTEYHWFHPDLTPSRSLKKAG